MQDIQNTIELSSNQFEVMLESNLLGFNQSWFNGNSMVVTSEPGIGTCSSIIAKVSDLRSAGYDMSILRVKSYQLDLPRLIQTSMAECQSNIPILLIDEANLLTPENLNDLKELMSHGFGSAEFPFKAVIYYGMSGIIANDVLTYLQQTSTFFNVKMTTHCAEKPYILAQADGSEFYIDNALHIERNDDLMQVVDDEQATQLAMQDCFCFISGVDGIPDNVYLHTLENYNILFPQ